MDEELEEFKKQNPGILTHRRNSVCDEGIVLDGKDTPLKIFPKSLEQKKLLKESARSLFIFSGVSDAELIPIVDCMYSRNVVKGERIIAQGYYCDLFYIVESGIFNEWIIQSNGKKILIDVHGPGSYFGQIALMHSMLHVSTVRAMSDGVLWQLQRSTFREIVLRAAYKRRLLFNAIINTIPEFGNLDKNDKLRVADSLQMKYFREGELIISRNSPPSGIYFTLPEGAVLRVFDKPGTQNIIELKVGDMFGESCMLNVPPRNINTICSSGTLALAFLPKSCIQPLLSECLDEILQNAQIKMKVNSSGSLAALF